jgi:outer membrane protein
MKKTAFLLATSGITSLSAAMILGFGTEVNYWAPEASGSFSYSNGGTTTTDFNQKTTDNYQIGVYLEHPIPLLPNLRLDYTSGQAYSGSSLVGGTNQVTLNQLDITPYYEILDNMEVDLDVGISAKVVDGSVDGVRNQNINSVIPMVYVSTEVNIPVLPLAVGADIKYFTTGGDSVTDARIRAIWKIMLGLEAQAGYRYENFNLDNRFDMTTDSTFKGPFVGVGYSF